MSLSPCKLCRVGFSPRARFTGQAVMLLTEESSWCEGVEAAQTSPPAGTGLWLNEPMAAAIRQEQARESSKVAQVTHSMPGMGRRRKYPDNVLLVCAMTHP